MLNWISSNLGTILVLLVIALMAGAAARSLICQKKAAKASGGCSGGCIGCPMCSSCHPAKKSR